MRKASLLLLARGNTISQNVARRFSRNVDRVENLVGLYQDLGGEGRGRRPLYSTDILRAATVLLHSALEDFLRSLARREWEIFDERTLNGIPMATGDATYRRGTKFKLPDLLEHRRKKVSTVIEESVDQHLDQSSFNNLYQVSEILTSVGVEPDAVNDRFSDLKDLMERRHGIVHQADRNPKSGRGHHRYKSISAGRVKIWIEAVREFVDAVMVELENQD